MLFDFCIERAKLTEYCFRFCETPHEGPPVELPCAEGEVKLWLFVNGQWSGPHAMGLSCKRGAFAEHSSELIGPDQWALRDAIYECKYRLMDVQRCLETEGKPVTGKKLMEAYRQRYPLAETVLCL
ncbi:hypothetical protein GCM10028805_36490 [Spirosoma harenae]